MHGRMPLWLLMPLLLTLGVGCTTTNPQKSVIGPPAGNISRVEDTPVVVKKADGPKRDPKPSTEIVIGRAKELEADSEALKSQPEARASLRDQARKCYQHALELDKNNVEAAQCLGRIYVKMGDCDRAQQVLKKAIDKHGKDASLWFELANCHKHKQDFAEASRCYAKALEFSPDNRDYMKTLGFALVWLGQVDQGLAQLTRGHQNADLAHYHVGMVLGTKDQIEQAQHHLRLALRENSQLPERERSIAQHLLTRLEVPSSSSGGVTFEQ